MENDVVAILSQPNIHFDPFKTLVNRQLNGRQGILRRRLPDSTVDNELNRARGKNGLKEICAEKWDVAWENGRSQDD
jgi:hypothetical protein